MKRVHRQVGRLVSISAAPDQVRARQTHLNPGRRATVQGCEPTGSARKTGGRAGITLLEVLVSVAIFLGALTTIMQLLSIGKRAEMMTRLQTEAIMRCEAKMAEVVSGVQPLDSISDEAFPDSEGSGVWQWSLESSTADTSGLLQVTVRVRYVLQEDDEVTSFELQRYLRDPQIFIDAALTSSEDSE